MIKMGTVTILPETPKDPLSLIGRRAGICWNADITNDEKILKEVSAVLNQVMEELWNL